MKNTIITFFLFFISTISFAQTKSCTIGVSSAEDSSWYSDTKKRADHLGLPDLINSSDAFHFRFWTSTQCVDIWTTDYKKFNGFIINSVSSFRSNQRQVKYYDSRLNIDTAIAHEIFNLFYNGRIFEIPTDDLILGWGRTEDGYEDLIEFSTPDQYSFKKYDTPEDTIGRLKEERIIARFENQITSILQMPALFEEFLQTASLRGCFHFGGDIIHCYINGVKRNEGESPTQFARRILNDSSIVNSKIVESKWDSKDVIISFNTINSAHTGQIDSLILTATIFISGTPPFYEEYFIDTIDHEGSFPQIESVFFTNADLDDSKELILIVSWEQQHYDVGGKLYGTYVYDDLRNSDMVNLTFLPNISRKLDGGCECEWRDGTVSKAKFKTENDIKAELIRLGYDQW